MRLGIMPLEAAVYREPPATIMSRSLVKGPLRSSKLNSSFTLREDGSFHSDLYKLDFMLFVL